ncbi:MAG: multiubiquitin domain-containing protein, partial [Acidobacteriota bacterium]
HHSPNPTTGQSLYSLGGVAAGMTLYREVNGNREDEPIENDREVLRLHQDEHFYSGPVQVVELAIVVNGQRKVVRSKFITFAQLVALAFNPVPEGPNILFTITYEDGPKVNREGTLLPGGQVKLKECMIFNVTATDKS